MTLKVFTIALVAIFISLVEVQVEARVNILDITTKQVYDIAVLRNQKRPVIVFYTKPSCGGGLCARLQKDLEALARENQETMNLAIVDMEKKPEFKAMFGISRIPTTRAFFKGKVVDQVQGPGWVSISKMIERVLEPKSK